MGKLVKIGHTGKDPQIKPTETKALWGSQYILRL